MASPASVIAALQDMGVTPAEARMLVADPANAPGLLAQRRLWVAAGREIGGVLVPRTAKPAVKRGRPSPIDADLRAALCDADCYGMVKIIAQRNGIALSTAYGLRKRVRATAKTGGRDA